VNDKVIITVAWVDDVKNLLISGAYENDVVIYSLERER